MKDWRQKAVLSVLVALVVWPLIHIFLVHQFDVNPWKLAGWGMYATPFTPGPRVHLYELGEGEPRRLELREVVDESVEIRESLSEFLKRRAVFGRLAEPEELAQLVLAEREVAHLLVRVETRFIDGKTGERKEKAADYPYSQASF